MRRQRGYDSLWALKSVRPAEELARLGIDKKVIGYDMQMRVRHLPLSQAPKISCILMGLCVVCVAVASRAAVPGGAGGGRRDPPPSQPTGTTEVHMHRPQGRSLDAVMRC